MSVTTMEVQGSDGVRRNIPLEAGAEYDTPIHALPTGAATASRQDTGNEILAAIESAHATEAKQDTANTSLGAIQAAVEGTLDVAVSSHPFLVDAFQRVAVASPTTLFDSQFAYDKQALLWEEITANNGSATHRPNECAVRLATTTDNGSSAALQTRQHFRYQPGKAQNVFLTFVMGVASAQVVRRAGYFDAENGLYLEQNGTTDVALVRRTYVSGTAVNNRVAQSDWNLDTLDGNGPSGYALDLSKAQILVVDLQFLGVGRVRIGFDLDGMVVFAHEFRNANNLSTVYMTTANLPLRYEQVASTGAAAASMDCICGAVISGGGFEDERGYLFASSLATAVTAGNGTRTCLLAIQPALTFNSLPNRETVVPLDLSVLSGNTNVLVEVVYGAAVTGGSWAVPDANSAVEVNKTATGITGGIVVDSFYLGASTQQARATAVQNIVSRLPLVLDAAGANPKGLAICATGLGGTSACYAAMSWKELR